LVNDNL